MCTLSLQVDTSKKKRASDVLRMLHRALHISASESLSSTAGKSGPSADGGGSGGSLVGGDGDHGLATLHAALAPALEAAIEVIAAISGASDGAASLFAPGEATRVLDRAISNALRRADAPNLL